jgi:hypothetical protein
MNTEQAKSPAVIAVEATTKTLICTSAGGVSCILPSDLAMTAGLPSLLQIRSFGLKRGAALKSADRSIHDRRFPKTRPSTIQDIGGRQGVGGSEVDPASTHDRLVPIVSTLTHNSLCARAREAQAFR